MGTSIQRLADELTATLARLLGYLSVLAALGLATIQVLEMDEIRTAIELAPRADWIAVERPGRALASSDDWIEGADRPQLRRSIAAK